MYQPPHSFQKWLVPFLRGHIVDVFHVYVIRSYRRRQGSIWLYRLSTKLLQQHSIVESMVGHFCGTNEDVPNKSLDRTLTNRTTYNATSKLPKTFAFNAECTSRSKRLWQLMALLNWKQSRSKEWIIANSFLLLKRSAISLETIWNL